MMKLTRYIISTGLIFWFSTLLFLAQVAKINEDYKTLIFENSIKNIATVNKINPVAEKPAEGSVVIVIDDIGSELESLRELAKIKLAFTIAVLPFQKYSREAAYFAKKQGWEVIIHVPMEPLDYPNKFPGNKALMVKMSCQELQKGFEEMYEDIPFAVGFNNHMGSKFTRIEIKLNPIMQIAKEKQLYFIDSKTTSASIAYKVALKNGIKAASRDLFLDNEINENVIREKFLKLISIANDNKVAIGICHTYPETVKILAELPVMLNQNKQNLIYASKGLEKKRNMVHLASFIE